LAADVDRLSGGRLVLGLGIGDAAGEFAQLGLTFPDAPTRQRALEETLRIVLGLWSGAPTTARGEHARADGTPPGTPRGPAAARGRPAAARVGRRAPVSTARRGTG
jgi:alkanesulfonate monooxygenase SsuD/methylene tetrahydromethanopterin reductase-like flavin-dependent oxidoreductase (luciferase family)